MPTGFDKFASKTLAEEGISIVPSTTAKKKEEKVSEKAAPETREVRKLAKAAVVGEKKAAAKPAAVEEPEETVQITIVIKSETKRKLDELKFTQRRKIKELTEEAIEDLYKKYSK